MKLLRPVVNIHQQQIIQQQILEEIIAVIFFLVCDQKILNLADCDPRHHQRIIAFSRRGEHIGRLAVLLNFHQVAVADDLAVYGRRGKTSDQRLVRFLRATGQHDRRARQIRHAEIDFRDILQFFKAALHYLCRNHSFCLLIAISDSHPPGAACNFRKFDYIIPYPGLISVTNLSLTSQTC